MTELSSPGSVILDGVGTVLVPQAVRNKPRIRMVAFIVLLGYDLKKRVQWEISSLGLLHIYSPLFAAVFDYLV
jgi:hypothetical protein